MSQRSIGVANLAGVAVALAASIALVGAQLSEAPPDRPTAAYVASVEVVERGGQRGVLDASGRFFPLQAVRRVVSLSLTADDLLLALCEPSRIAAFSAHANTSAAGYRFGPHRMAVASPSFEDLAAHKPDLVLAHSLSLDAKLRAARDAGMPIFDLGTQRGMETLLPNIRTVALLLGRPGAGSQLTKALQARMAALATRVPLAQQPRGVYVGVHGDKLYGGTRGTSYADVLRAAGIRDVAASHFEGWPRYTAEHLLKLDPDVIVTQTGMRQVLCAQPGMDALRACQSVNSIVEMDGSLLVDPGLEIPRAAELLQSALLGASPEP